LFGSLNAPLSATALSRSDDYGFIPNNVADAFNYRKYLVELIFAQERFVVAVLSLEGSPIRVALGRARRVRNNLGNLLACSVHDDTDKQRSDLGVGGEAYAAQIERDSRWYDLKTG
jgi:hypothetical protein